MPESPRWRGEWPTAEGLAGRAAQVLNLRIEIPDAERLVGFLQLLERWAAKFNLIASSSRAEVVDRHLLDSLAILRVLGSARAVADFGSGAGFPGIPLAVACRDAKVFLVESRRHRANFLRQAVRTLALDNAEVFDGRGQSFPASIVEVVVGRAVRLDELAAFARRALRTGGRLIWMTKSPAAEPALARFRTLRRAGYSLPPGRAHELLELELMP
jgi:16S rRNA (guanine527-N7)-methyltransferase